MMRQAIQIITAWKLLGSIRSALPFSDPDGSDEVAMVSEGDSKGRFLSIVG